MEEIDLKDLFNIFWNKKLFIITTIIVFALIGIIYSKLFIKPDYKAISTIVLTKNVSDEEKITQTEVTLNQKLVATYAQLIKSNNILRQVISNSETIDITEEQLRNSVTVTSVINSQLIEVSVTNPNPETAQILTNEITKVFIEKVKEIYKIDNINIVDEAKVPDKPYNMNHEKNIFRFASLGAIFACGCVSILNLMDTTIKTSDQVEKSLGLNVLVSIPNYKYDGKKKGKK